MSSGPGPKYLANRRTDQSHERCHRSSLPVSSAAGGATTGTGRRLSSTLSGCSGNAPGGNRMFPGSESRRSPADATTWPRIPDGHDQPRSPCARPESVAGGHGTVRTGRKPRSPPWSVGSIDCHYWTERSAGRARRHHRARRVTHAGDDTVARGRPARGRESCRPGTTPRRCRACRRDPGRWAEASPPGAAGSTRC